LEKLTIDPLNFFALLKFDIRVSSDRENRENRELAGKLNDPGKKREMAGHHKNKKKSGNFHSIILIL